jgi:pyruvyltransferase
MPCIYNLNNFDNLNNVDNVNNQIDDINKKKEKESIIGIIPHYVDKNNKNLKELVKNLKKEGYNVKIIDIEVGDKYKKLIDEINKCEYIISSSLHGVIMGVVYKKKTVFIEFSNKVIGDKFKFYDFFGSMDIDYEYKHLLNKDLLDNTINIDYEVLKDKSSKFIDVIPFIDNNRKDELKNILDGHYKNCL